MGVIATAIFLLGVGLLFLIWPEELRDWILRSYARAGFTGKIIMQDLMFTRGYILAYRVGGAISLVAGAVLLWRMLT